MKSIGELKDWEEVQEYFTKAEQKRFENPTQHELDELNATKRFRMVASYYAPSYDFERNSVQIALLNWFQEERKYLGPLERLQAEDRTRLFREFRIACEKLLGTNWESVSDFEQIERMRTDAYQIELDRSFGVVNPLLRVEFRQAASVSAVHQFIVRFWTNPDFPLWLMPKSTISSVIDHRFGRGTLSENSIETTLARLGLRQLKHQPIREVSFGDPIRFHFASYLPESLCTEHEFFRGFPPKRGIRLDGSHFLKSG